MPTSDVPRIPSVSTGDILAGKYRVERILGAGGMGVVVAATHLDLHEVRAVKLMHPASLENLQSVERFLREARATVRLRSEHVAEVHDVGRLESGAPYIVMELLHGEDLSSLQKKRGPFPIDEAVLHIMQACHAVAEAHIAGIVHRDLKPGNLFLTCREDGSTCIKVLDFGISKYLRGSEEAQVPEITVTRAFMGTPHYMAPEQMRSARSVDARADVWSLGAILYKLLTGRAPFQSPAVSEVVLAALNGTPVRRPSELRPEIPAALELVILRCLDNDPARRYSCAGELLVALRPFGPGAVPLEDDGEKTLMRPSAEPLTMMGSVTTTMPLPHPSSTGVHARADEIARSSERDVTEPLPPSAPPSSADPYFPHTQEPSPRPVHATTSPLNAPISRNYFRPDFRLQPPPVPGLAPTTVVVSPSARPSAPTYPSELERFHYERIPSAQPAQMAPVVDIRALKSLVKQHSRLLVAVTAILVALVLLALLLRPARAGEMNSMSSGVAEAFLRIKVPRGEPARTQEPPPSETTPPVEKLSERPVAQPPRKGGKLHSPPRGKIVPPWEKLSSTRELFPRKPSTNQKNAKTTNSRPFNPTKP